MISIFFPARFRKAISSPRLEVFVYLAETNSHDLLFLTAARLLLSDVDTLINTNSHLVGYPALRYLWKNKQPANAMKIQVGALNFAAARDSPFAAITTPIAFCFCHLNFRPRANLFIPLPLLLARFLAQP